MADTRKKNFNWRIHTNADGTTPSADAHLAVFMDIRDELQKLNRVFECPNFLRIPWTLDEIRKQTKKKRKKRVKKEAL